MSPSRRDVLATGAKAAAIGTGTLVAASLGATGAPALADPTAACADRLTQHILTTQLSPGTSAYDPPLSTAVETHSLHIEINVLGGVTVDGRVLQSATIDGNYVRGCTGLKTSPTLRGVLTWTSGPPSAFAVDSVTGGAASGHSTGITQGHIVSGPYAGATVKIVGVRRANIPTACLTGGPVDSATGYDIIVIEN
jgi:hypothetical protein